jgi:hypothetical protein
MSNHHVLAAVSCRIRHILWEGINSDEATRALMQSKEAIRVGTPDPSDPDGRLFIWLYQIRPNLYQADLPMRHITDIAEPQPLPLDLSYMLVPTFPSDDHDGANLVVLARTMQIMAANSRIVINEPGFDESLRAILEDPAINEQILLWRALRMPMRLAAYYAVSPVRIDPLGTSS